MKALLAQSRFAGGYCDGFHDLGESVAPAPSYALRLQGKSAQGGSIRRDCGFHVRPGSPGLNCAVKERILALFDLLEKWFEKEDFFGCVFINAVAEHEKDSRWVKEVAGAYRDQIIDRLKALIVESGARDPEVVTQKLGLIIEGAIVTAMVTQNSKAAHIARLAAEDVFGYRVLPSLSRPAPSATAAAMEPV